MLLFCAVQAVFKNLANRQLLLGAFESTCKSLDQYLKKMKITIDEGIDEDSGRIEEIPDGEEIKTCFITNRPVDPDLGTNYGMGYCCTQHRDLHVPEAEDDSDEGSNKARPFRVLYRPEVGRYVVAARDIEPGEVIFSEEALAIGPSHDALPCCLDCMKPITSGSTYVCPKCQLPVCEEMCALGEEHIKGKELILSTLFFYLTKRHKQQIV